MGISFFFGQEKQSLEWLLDAQAPSSASVSLKNEVVAPKCTPPIRVYLRRLEAEKNNYVGPFLKQFH